MSAAPPFPSMASTTTTPATTANTGIGARRLAASGAHAASTSSHATGPCTPCCDATVVATMAATKAASSESQISGSTRLIRSHQLGPFIRSTLANRPVDALIPEDESPGCAHGDKSIDGSASQAPEGDDRG